MTSLAGLLTEVATIATFALYARGLGGREPCGAVRRVRGGLSRRRPVRRARGSTGSGDALAQPVDDGVADLRLRQEDDALLPRTVLVTTSERTAPSIMSSALATSRSSAMKSTSCGRKRPSSCSAQMSDESGGESATAASATFRASVAIASAVVDAPIRRADQPDRSGVDLSWPCPQPVERRDEIGHPLPPEAARPATCRRASRSPPSWR